MLYLELFLIAVSLDFNENLACRAKMKPLHCFKFYSIRNLHHEIFQLCLTSMQFIKFQRWMTAVTSKMKYFVIKVSGSR